ncbi:MAG: endonuclease/exonuclease/phosphatase family protein [Bacteroidetes bacterium]|nr:endonuclease/exonuclease/phosphatase family protein [Bacteroidota bacterium]
MKANTEKSFIRRWGKTIALLANVLVALLLLFSYLAPYISPENFWYIAFLGLGYPALLLVNFIFILFWLFLKWRLALISLVSILIGYSNIAALVQINLSAANHEKNHSEKEFKLMSYNVRLFDLYNWTKNKETRNKIFDLLIEEAPDIICFQEFYQDDTDGFKTRDTLLAFQKAKYVHEEYTYNYTSKRDTLHIGLATFSKFPIVGKGVVPFEVKNNNICMFTDVVIQSDTIRIYNMHLQSIHFSNSDYKFVESIMTDKEAEEEVEKSKKILSRLKSAFKKRALQAEAVAAHIAKCPYKVIVCGDFNDTPSSYAYSKISSKLNDAFMEKGFGFGKSYAGKFPSFRIDYILHSKQLELTDFSIVREELSDHFPICGTFTYR